MTIEETEQDNELTAEQRGEVIGVSPLPSSPRLEAAAAPRRLRRDLSFMEALELTFREKAHITRTVWGTTDFYVSLQGDGEREILVLMKEDGLYHPWTISVIDFAANDWETI